jgi:two-component sensor histidine kinase
MKSFLRFAAAPNGLQKIVGLTVGTTAILVGVLNAFSLLVQPGYNLVRVLSDLSVVLVAAIGVIGVISGFWRSFIAKWLQIVIFFLSSILNAFTSTTGGNLSSGIFLIYGLILISEYSLGRSSIWFGAIITIVVYPVALFFGYRTFPGAIFYQVTTVIIGVAVLIILYGAVILKHELRHREDTALLESRVKERTAELEHALEERSVMLQEIHHRVKNNLQIITSILGLESEMDESEASRASREKSIQRIYAMALVHETLYQTDQLENVDLAKYADRLIDEIRAASRVEFELEAEGPLYVGLDFAVPFGLLLNELLTNAEKHAFPVGFAGRVDIRIDSEEGLRLSVADNGLGMSEDIRLEGAKTLGLNLVNVLAKQLNGAIALDRSSGTRWTITFPTKGE